jgi:hypothetical protein
MYAIITDGSISKYVNHPKPLVIGDVQYPARIFSAWTASELAAIGIIEVTFDDSNKKDEKWYINTNQTYTYDASAGTVTATSGTAVPSSITTHRAAVRTKAAEMETAITNASDTPALETLYTYTEQEDGSVTRPLGELPRLES